MFKPIKNFVAVGVGPLTCDPQFASSGPPHESLIGDMKFLVERMKLVGPPLHIETKKEKRIFNDHLKENPKPTTKS